MSTEPDWLIRGRADGSIVEKPTLGESLAKLTSVSSPDASEKKSKKAVLLPHQRLGTGKWQVGVEVVNESNLRDWKGRNRRAGAVWKAVREAVTLLELVAFELRLRHREHVYARFTRIGPRIVDRHINLPACFKGVEDCVCYLLGIDDSNPLWHLYFDQQKGKEVGILIELSFEKFNG
jgi:hypothetical protein